MKVWPRNGCTLCRSDNIVLALTLASTPPANAFGIESTETYPLEVGLCMSCGHSQLMTILDPEELFGSYLYASGVSQSFRKHFSELAHLCVDRFSPMTVLDIGSNDGTLLRSFTQAGLQAFGIEPSRILADQCSEDGLDVVCNFFTPELAKELASQWGPVDLITANNVFAHAENLRAIAEGVKTMLTDDGVFVFEVQYLGDLMAKGYFDLCYHEHYSYHALTPLIRFFPLIGMEVFDVQRINTHGGSLRVFARKQKGTLRGGRPFNGLVSQIEHEERQSGICLPAAWQDVEKSIKKARKSFMVWAAKMRIQLRTPTICGYGAPAKLTTLVYTLLEGSPLKPDQLNQVVQFVVDDSPLKQGLHTPGTKIPIVSSNRLHEATHCIIFAWNMAKEIIAANPDYKGKWVIPLPETKVL